MSVETLKTIVLALIGISVIWLIRILVKKETENIARTLLVGALLGGAYFYLQNTKLETLHFSDIKNQIKDTFFPEKPANYIFHREERNDASGNYIRYFFESPGPRLSLELDPSGKYFNIKDLYSINRILKYLGLPEVDRRVPELASITGSANDINMYRWDNYEMGILTVERAICQDRDMLESYQCIANVLITRR
jgi:hypothetical protein